MLPNESVHQTGLRKTEIESMLVEINAMLESTTTSPIAVRRQDLVRIRVILRANADYIDRLHRSFIDMHEQRDRHNEIYHT